MATSNTQEARNPYTLIADDGEVVDVSRANPRRTIKIHGRRIRVSDIPITAATLACGHSIRGIAFAEGALVYCDKHGDQNLTATSVVKVMG